MLNAGHVVEKNSGLTLSTTDATVEFNQSEYADLIEVSIVISSASSLTDARIRLEEYDPLTDDWVTAIQECLMVSVDSGTPDVANENTASTTAVAGGVSKNALGITDIDDNGTFRLRKFGNGKRTRLFYDVVTSGSASLAYAAVMKQNFAK